jgi:hypothetical protein
VLKVQSFDPESSVVVPASLVVDASPLADASLGTRQSPEATSHESPGLHVPFA